MAEDLKKEESIIEKTEAKLYNPKIKEESIFVHRIENNTAENIPTAWSGGDDPIIKPTNIKEGASIGYKLLLFSLVILIISIAWTSFRIFSSSNVVSSSNIGIDLNIESSVEGGEDTPLSVSIHNKNKTTLLNSVITLSYKKGVGAQDEQEKVEEKIEIGDIKGNEYKNQDFKVLVYGKEADTRDINLKLEYKVEGSNALFSKNVSKTVVIKTSPVSIHVDGPSTLSSSQVGEYKVILKNNTRTASLKSAVLVNLPNSFKVENTFPKKSSSLNVWQIEPLLPGESTTITITGSMTGGDGDVNTIKASVGSQEGQNIGVVYSSDTIDTEIKSSQIVLNMSLDTDRGQSEGLRYGDKATLTIKYKNSGISTLSNFSIKLYIDGEAPIIKQIYTQDGYFESQKKTITWNRDNVSKFSNLKGGEEGYFIVTIPIITQSDSSPSLKLNLEAGAFDENGNDVSFNASKVYPVLGKVTVSGKTSYNNSPFQNTGPIPPNVNVGTTYDAKITVSTQNSINSGKVYFSLPIYVTWKNTTTDDGNISYDSKNRKVTWNVGDLTEGKTKSVDIQLLVTPTQTHVNQAPSITSNILFEAVENNSNKKITTTSQSLTTQINGEVWPGNPSLVVDK